MKLKDDHMAYDKTCLFLNPETKSHDVEYLTRVSKLSEERGDS